MSGIGYSYGGDSSSDDYGRRTVYVPEHVCRPVIIDADGRKRPIISYRADQNADHYVTKTETYYQELVYPPMEYEDKHVPRWAEENRVAENKFRLASADDRPQKVEEFITKVQIEASRPKEYAPWDASYRRQTPKSTGYDGYDEYNGFNNKDLLKPRGDAHRNDNNYDDYYRKQGSNMEPTMKTSGGWARPSHSTWAAPPNAPLSGATNDISAAVELLREAAKPSVTTSPPSRYREPAYANTIDSKEAARRYGKFNFSSRPYARDDSYTSTIDSREAARKYSGSAV
ncbi:PREDICTED: uncharacterized protein LOC105110465 [Populus euphratica]|uniref:Uncharacterized protein LOC105110465 n=1 Tax=Populus euphratica TaxID=75702 RepID=A0AAJ6T3Z0_POPEU|nr:PREDICTED: uncharacterized protein LOC105110465 [Populus euphratica]